MLSDIQKAQRFKKLLLNIKACSTACEWAKGKTFEEAWKTCERGDWMLWLLGKMSGTQGWPSCEDIVLAMCAEVRTALKFVPKGEERPRIAIETAERWAHGNATLEEVKTATNASSCVPGYIASAATYVGYVVGHAATDASVADIAGRIAFAVARLKALKESADRIRQQFHVKIERIACNRKDKKEN